MSALTDFLSSERADFRKARLSSLYSDFRSQRTINPDGYAANIAAWENGLAAAAKDGVLPDGRLAIQSGTQLEHQLQTREHGLPLAIDAVIEEATMNGRMIPLTHFLSSSKSIYDRSWDLSLSTVPLKLASWALQQAGLISKAPKDPAHKYVLIGNLEEHGNVFAKNLLEQTRRVDRAIPMDEFRKKLAGILNVQAVTDSDLGIVLTFLHRDKGLIAYNNKAVKVKTETESEPTLTDEDVNICSLKALISELNDQVAIVTERIEQLQDKAKEAVSKKNKTSAMAALRSKKVQEELLSKRSATLGQLEGIFAKIEEAADQVEVVKAMEGSTQVLRGLTSEIGGIERVEDVLESLHEEMSKVDEVGTMMGEQSSIAARIDETAVDDELEQLEAEANAEQERKDAAATQQRLESLDIAGKPADISDRTLQDANKEEPRPVAESG